MQTISKSQFVRFVNAQRNRRQLNMNHSTNGQGVGHPLIHFGNSHKFEFQTLGFRALVDKNGRYAAQPEGFNSLEFPKNIRTYGQLKRHLKQTNWINKSVHLPLDLVV